jgi:hypothetical protein
MLSFEEFKLYLELGFIIKYVNGLYYKCDGNQFYCASELSSTYYDSLFMSKDIKDLYTDIDKIEIVDYGLLIKNDLNTLLGE